jgi:hypothetical protein
VLHEGHTDTNERKKLSSFLGGSSSLGASGAACPAKVSDYSLDH